MPNNRIYTIAGRGGSALRRGALFGRRVPLSARPENKPPPIKSSRTRNSVRGSKSFEQRIIYTIPPLRGLDVNKSRLDGYFRLRSEARVPR